MSSKKRYSIPAKIVELMFADDTFFNDVVKIKKVSGSHNKFPRMDQWVDGDGFNMSFALAGYSSGDIGIETYRNTVHIKSGRLEEQRYNPPTISESEDAFKEYYKDVKPGIQAGYVVRGIARRSFDVAYMISEEFDIAKIDAYMEHGLLHITVPFQDPELVAAKKTIVIKTERN